MEEIPLEKLETTLVAGGILITIFWLLRVRRNFLATKRNEPPVLPYWILWPGHALSYASGSDKVFRAARYVSFENAVWEVHQRVVEDITPKIEVQFR